MEPTLTPKRTATKTREKEPTSGSIAPARVVAVLFGVETWGSFMKQLLALVFVGSLLTVPAQADYLKNPDRTLSMGVDVTATHLDNAFPGLHLFDASGGRNLFLPDRQPITSHFLTLDVRCPLSEAITMDAHGGSWTQEAFQGTSNGYTIGGGLRYYFHGGD